MRARLNVLPERFLIDNVVLQTSVKGNLVPRVPSTLGTMLREMTLIRGYFRAKIQNLLSTNQSLNNFVFLFTFAQNLKLLVNWAYEEKCLCTYSTVAYFVFLMFEVLYCYLGFVFLGFNRKACNIVEGKVGARRKNQGVGREAEWSWGKSEGENDI